MSEAIDLSDIPELGEEFFVKARRISPLVQKHTVLVDREVYEWFKDTFPEPESSKRIDQILRVYMERYRGRLAALG
ncbi:3-oxoacyl-ACP synthase [Pseudoduganella sp. FT26W]|jgi:hypothetical protein|uniref:3-oxoacyl-ACP synthase n=1 Tax=Duganella aquatilis TaxID=2666082 RepID=A0A844D9H6_9BURK|nr:3-oxoacyl-ACP synthase [Duganella aquatilis]MRW83664.1 3-oxoacyl-ACP synthase [Duganella aquatilis]